MRERSGKRKFIIAFLVIIVAVAALGLAMHIIEARGLRDEQFGDTGNWGNKEKEATELSFGDRIFITYDDIDTYLIIGTDSGGKDEGEMYSDELADFVTLLVADNTTKKFAFLQLDRNSMVDIQVLDENGEVAEKKKMQLCISHWYGSDIDARNRNTAAAVSELLGSLPVENCYSLEMTDIGAVNHAIGGVVVEIDEDMTNIDPAFTQGATVLLTDKQAERFVRARMNVGDGTNKSRMARQQQYMQKAYNLVMSQIRENPDYLNDLYSELKGKIHAGQSESNFGNMTSQILEYESLGILQFKGESRINDTIGEGIEHEEFYVDEDSVITELGKVINLDKPSSDYYTKY